MISLFVIFKNKFSKFVWLLYFIGNYNGRGIF